MLSLICSSSAALLASCRRMLRQKPCHKLQLLVHSCSSTHKCSAPWVTPCVHILPMSGSGVRVGGWLNQLKTASTSGRAGASIMYPNPGGRSHLRLGRHCSLRQVGHRDDGPALGFSWIQSYPRSDPGVQPTARRDGLANSNVKTSA